MIILQHMELLPLTDSLEHEWGWAAPKLNSDQLTFSELVLKSVLSCLADGYELEDWGTVFQFPIVAETFLHPGQISSKAQPASYEIVCWARGKKLATQFHDKVKNVWS